MHRFAAALLALGALSGPLGAVEPPPLVREAILLELEGRLAEALDRYRAALISEPSLTRDEALALPLTVQVLSKAAHLSIDLGLGEEAWDLAGRLLASSDRRALAAGTRIRDRLGRLAGVASSPSTPEKSPPGSPAARVGEGRWFRIVGPAEALGLAVQEPVRIPVGAFQDWGRALTLVDMLREKGWSPFTDVRALADGSRVHSVYLISRQPESDRRRLVAEGLLTSGSTNP